jgi:biotin-dependent carboxylase-like uncharacterized protein
VIEVLSPGALTTIQDLGRPGWAHLGVPPSGAADPRSLRLANRLVGNPEGAAALEATIRGPVLRFSATAVVALAGAPVAARVGNRALGMHTAEEVNTGDVLDVGFAKAGARTYVAVRGGIGAEPVLGSASTDVLSGLGPPVLEASARLTVGDEAEGPVTAHAPPGAPLAADPVLRVVPGPREDRFDGDAIAELCGAAWEVSPASNRVGVRLRGPNIAAVDGSELRSEGLVTGSLQVPPSGEPIVMLTDHPTTGGYPVLAVVVSSDLPLVGQLRPGGRVTFTCPSRS